MSSGGGASGGGSGNSSKSKAAHVQDRCQALLDQLLKDDDNKYCVDCDAKGPRWASWNLGIFLCIRCAGIHRNLGVHISKVKSVNLDSWTPEQVVTLQQMGNSRARAVYEANLPDSFRRPQTDSALEAFIRAKYEHRKYVAREWVPPDPPQVNWDKEIELELEKQKKKKKSSTTTVLGNTSTNHEKKSTKSDVVPQLLPKPKSSASPKPGRSTPKRDLVGTTDLLGTTSKPAPQVQQNDDVFSSFLSAPISEEVKKPTEPTVVDLKSEEESFFNQPAPTEKEKSKMTKDSILALYGQTPCQPLNSSQFSQNGAFPTQFPQGQSFNQLNNANFGAGNAFPAQQGFMQNNIMPQQQPQNNFGAFNQFTQQQPQVGFHNQFAASQSMFPQQNAFQSQVNPQMNMGNVNQQQTGQYSSLTNQFSSSLFSNSSNGQSVFPQSNSPQMFSSQQGLGNLSQNFNSLSMNQNGKPTSMSPVPNLGMGFPAKPAQPTTNITSNGIWQ